MIRDLVIEGGFRFLAYHDTLGNNAGQVTNPENETRGIWILLGMLALIVVAVIIFSKQNKQK